MMSICEVLTEDGPLVCVKVIDEKRPKWIDLSQGKYALFSNTDDAESWIKGTLDVQSRQTDSQANFC